MNQLQKNVFLTYFRTTFLLLLTFFLGAVIATGVARMLEKSKDAIADNKPDPTDFCDVFVLKNTIREGKEISPENIIVVRLPKNEVPRSAVKTYQQIDGCVAQSEIPLGTVLRDESFVSRITQNAANGFIPPGYHSVAIRIHEAAVDGPSGISAVLPGDQVDIILVQKNAEKDDEPEEFVLLEKIPVIDAFWDEIGDFQRNEKKGIVSLLLSDSQRKNLEEECHRETKIRLRICPPMETQMVGESQPQHPADSVTHDFYQTGNPPELLSQSLKDDTRPIEIVFCNNQEFMPIHHNELQIPSFRGVPSESYGDKNAKIPPVSTTEKPNSVHPPGGSPPVPRYSSFFDAASQKGHGNTLWRAVPPQSPLVFEARSGSDTRTRGIYQENGVYYSVK